MDARRFKECKRVTDSYRMKRFDEVADEKCETKSVMFHFDLEYLPDRVFLDPVSYPVKKYVPKLLHPDPECLLCKGNHAAWESKCPKRVREAEIIRVRSKKRSNPDEEVGKKWYHVSMK